LVISVHKSLHINTGLNPWFWCTSRPSS